MMIHDITKLAGSHRRRKRIGRGPASGNGKTAGRGHKGARSRSGWSGTQAAAFQGGSMPYFRQIPKRGFSNFNFRKHYNVINVKELEAKFESGSEVNLDTLVAVGMIRDRKLPVKVLGEGELTKKLTVTAVKFSESAKKKIEGAGGTCSIG